MTANISVIPDNNCFCLSSCLTLSTMSLLHFLSPSLIHACSCRKCVRVCVGVRALKTKIPTAKKEGHVFIFWPLPVFQTFVDWSCKLLQVRWRRKDTWTKINKEFYWLFLISLTRGRIHEARVSGYPRVTAHYPDPADTPLLLYPRE